MSSLLRPVLRLTLSLNYLCASHNTVTEAASNNGTRRATRGEAPPGHRKAGRAAPPNPEQGGKARPGRDERACVDADQEGRQAQFGSALRASRLVRLETGRKSDAVLAIQTAV